MSLYIIGTTGPETAPFKVLGSYGNKEDFLIGMLTFSKEMLEGKYNSLSFQTVEIPSIKALSNVKSVFEPTFKNDVREKELFEPIKLSKDQLFGPTSVDDSILKYRNYDTRQAQPSDAGYDQSAPTSYASFNDESTMLKQVPANFLVPLRTKEFGNRVTDDNLKAYEYERSVPTATFYR